MQPPMTSGLLTDLYQLTMAAGYLRQGMLHNGTFELFVRGLPAHRGFLVCAGLQQVLDYLTEVHFEPEEIDYLKSLSVFSNVGPDFWDYLGGFRFSGEVWAVGEGTVAFAGEPLLRVTAPLPEAQIVETWLLAMMNFQTIIATKAARVVIAACSDGRERPVVDFGSRRAHGPEAGVLAARASFIGGCSGTSNVWAGKAFGIPVFGTQAHSFVMAFASELEAFKSYHELFPDSTTLLVDTYDVENGVRNAARVGKGVKAIRLDSGDLLDLSRRAREILDASGMSSVHIIGSGDLNEYKIAELVASKAPIDSFGVGTEMVTSRDAPSLGGVYKLVEQHAEGLPRWRAKFSPDKATYPGAKQVWRLCDENGRFSGDVVALADEKAVGDAEPLLSQVMSGGEIARQLPTLQQVREHAAAQMRSLPDSLLSLTAEDDYPVRRSEAQLEKMDELASDMETGHNAGA